MKRISIVTPSYNQAEFLERCIDSILSQNYPNLDYIIMDGGSTDGSLEIIKKHQKHLSYWQSCPDGGQYEAVNAGFKRSSGEIMGWLNSDDMLHKGGLSVLNDVFSRLPHVEFLTARRVGFDGDDNLLSFNYFNQTWCHDHLLRKELIRDLSLFIMQEGTYWRRGLWERAGSALDASFRLAADFELWVRLSRHAALYTVDALTGGFRYHSDEQRCNKYRRQYVSECYEIIDRELSLGLPSLPHMTAPPALIRYPLAQHHPPEAKPQTAATPTPTPRGTAVPVAAAPTSASEGLPSPSEAGTLVVFTRSRPQRISIVTPSYNQGEYLEECIDSVLSQNYPELEYIVMDGGSTDGSLEIIKRYQKHLAHWQCAPDRGQYHAINDGFLRSSGAVMAWLNSDDKFHPGALYLVDLGFRGMPEADWITGRPTLWDGDGHLISVFSNVPAWSWQRLLSHTPEDLCVQQESTFWRRTLWDRAGGSLDTQWLLAADFELWCRFSRHAQLMGVDALLGGFRCHSDQKTATRMVEYEAEVRRIIERELAVTGCRQLQPVAPAVTIEQIAQISRPELGTEAFSYFSYFRSQHFSWFAEAARALYGREPDHESCTVAAYQQLLCHAVITRNIPPGGRILEIGSGASGVSAALKQQYECWIIGGSAGSVTASQGFHTAAGSIGAYSEELPREYFDFAFSIGSLEGFPDSQEQFRRICSDLLRVLKPGGFSLHCFEAWVADGLVSAHPLAGYMLRNSSAIGRPVPFGLLQLDPFALFLHADTPGAANREKVASVNCFWGKPQAPEPA